MQTSDALQQIANVVGDRGLVEGAGAKPFLHDERGLYQGEAALVVRPASTEECARVVEICSEYGLGIVPQGGNTGYCGGATPFDGQAQIVVNLSRMNRVLQVDGMNFTMTVQAGVVLSQVHAAAAQHDLMFPLSMGSEGSCLIGGVLSTNGGGVSVLRYGSARDLVLGLEVILPNGSVLSELKGLRKDNTGYDLRALFVGAEGTLGLITAAVLKLFPSTRSRETAFLAVPSPAAACDLLRRARRASGERVVSAEYISRSSLELVLKHVAGARDPFDEPSEHYLLLEMAGGEGDAELRGALEQLVGAAFERDEIIDGVVAESGQQREALWRLRETIPEAERREGGSVKHDISVRVSSIPEFLERAAETLSSLGPHRLSVFGHVGDGNLHYNVLPPEGESFEAFRPELLPEAVHDLAVDMGGSFSAEHGIGVLKRAELEKYASPVALELMRALKTALDPKGIMNPGKLLG